MKEERDIIWTPKPVINENVMRNENSVVQMSNVSRCEVESMPKESYPVWAIAGLQLCIVIIIAQVIKEEFPFYRAYIPALIGFVMCSMNLLIIFSKNRRLEMYLIFELNSGGILLFRCHDKRFLKKVHKAVIDCFNYRDISYTINFEDCII